MGAPEQLGPYKIDAQIGAGGMGQVFRATDTRLHRTVAIKILPHDKIASPDRQRRFLQEARAASALNHPNIITLYDIDEDSGVDYLVMEYVAGEPLDKLISPKGLPAAEVIDYAIQIAGALVAAHGAGIIHRDIKPANVIVTADGQVKVLDFGLAKLLEPSRNEESATRTIAPALTDAGTVMGTVAYMSPEQARGEEVDERSDLFSLGVVLYEMAAGRRPFLRTLDWTTPATDSFPAELRPIVLKLLEVDRDLRYRHASDLRADLLRLKRETDPERVTRGRRPGRWKLIAIAAAGAVLALLSFAYFRLHAAPRLTDKDRIVLADFKNTTGDTVFDGTLRQGLTVQLEQSPFLSLVPEDRIQRTLGLMGRPADAALTPEVAREICERTASAAVLDGSISSLGSQYVVGLRAKNCRTGDILDEEQAQAARKEDVLSALSQIASKFRTRIGESLSTVEKYSTSLQEATTPSLEALKTYSAALKIYHSSGPASMALFKRAIEVDPNFAMAYAYLGHTYAQLGMSGPAGEATSRAYQLRDRTSDAEKFLITASYELRVEGNLEKMEQTCETWAQTYPREMQAPGMLGGIAYQILGKREKSIESLNKAIEIDPDFALTYSDLAESYIVLGRLDDAEKALQRATARKLDSLDTAARYAIAFLRSDRAAVERILSEKPEQNHRDDMRYDLQALDRAYFGRLKQAREMTRRAVDLSQQASQLGRMAQWETAAALREAFFGNSSEARRMAAIALEHSGDREILYGAALALILAGDAARGQILADDIEKRFPEDTSSHFSYLPSMRAALALYRGEPSKAIEASRLAIPNELGTPRSKFHGFFGALYPVYMRGLAYLALHQGAAAAAEFQKILDQRCLMVSDPVGALSRLQLGRALVISGDRAKAKAAYQDFLTLWKDADPDIPVLVQAKSEFGKLN